MTDKMREEFEAWAVDEGFNRERVNGGPYLFAVTAAAWKSWQASRAAVVVELPSMPSAALLKRVMPDDYWYGDIFGFTAQQMKSYANKAIEAAGVRVKK